MSSTFCALPGPSPFQNTASSSSVVSQEEDMDWRSALSVLAKFASLDAGQYASLLVSIERKNQRASPSSSNSHQQDQENCQLLVQLEAFRRDGVFGETSIPELVQAIHRFHSNLAHWHQEDTRQLQEIQQLQEALAASKACEADLAKECQKLTKQNAKLRAKLREKRHVLAKARTWFRESVAERESLQEIATVAQLQVHEQVMAATSGRIRLGSTDSNFSDVDALDFIGNGHNHHAGGGGSNSSCATSANNDGNTTTEGSVEESETSQSSLVTDDGVATLRFGVEETPPRVTATSSTYTLEFPSGVKTGMRLKAVPVSDWVPLSKPSLSPEELLLDGSESTTQEETECSCPGDVDDGDDDEAEQQQQQNVPDGVAFVVCGQYQVDSDDDETTLPRVALPPVGARIMAVRDQKVSLTWTMSEVLGAMSSTTDQRPVFSVTFRNGRVLKSNKSFADCSDDDESSADGEKPESNPPGPPIRNHRPGFHLLPFGNKYAKARENGGSSSENQTNNEKVAAEIANHSTKSQTNKGHGNPLMFWRQDEKGNRHNLDDLSLEESATPGDDSKEPVDQTLPAKTAAATDGSDKAESTKADANNINKLIGNPLMFWKKDEGGDRPREDTADSIGLRPRRNTVDSCGVTEGTVMSKEDASVASCSDLKPEESHSTEEASCDRNSSASQRGIPMKQLMFWRKSDQTLESSPETTQQSTAPEKPRVESEKSTRPDGVDIETATPEKHFRLDFWNVPSRQPSSTTNAESAVSQSEDAAEVEVIREVSKEQSDGKLLDSSCSVDDVEPKDDEQKPSEGAPQEATTEMSTYPDENPNSDELMALATEKCLEEAPVATEQTDETVKDMVVAVDAAAKELPSQCAGDETSTKEDQDPSQEQPTTSEHNGPLNKMGRFFSNRFGG